MKNKKQIKELQNLAKDEFAYILNVINSIKNTKHVESCYRMIYNFEEKWSKSIDNHIPDYNVHLKQSISKRLSNITKEEIENFNNNINNKSKSVILLRGCPGNGKSTLAELICNKEHICTADDFFIDVDGNYNFDSNKIELAHKECQTKCETLLKENIKIIVVANTSTTEKEVSVYKKLALKYNYMFFSVIVENRNNTKNIHNVPEETIEKMKKRFSTQL
jgi:predicted kinase